jgi:hypothetical protein
MQDIKATIEFTFNQHTVQISAMREQDGAMISVLDVTIDEPEGFGGERYQQLNDMVDHNCIADFITVPLNGERDYILLSYKGEKAFIADVLELRELLNLEG